VAGWLVVLIVTNAASLAALVFGLRRRGLEEEPADGAEVFVAPRPAGVTTRSRRLITIEVLNPIELVGSRGRVASLAGSLAPGIARRLVYDQVLKTLRRELADKQVVADVRLHQLRPLPRPVAVPVETAEVEIVDEVSPIDLDHLDEPAPEQS
jgi:hypothetical protein